MIELFYRVTEGIRITAQPFFHPERSDPTGQRFVFTYRIRIENVGAAPARLRWRHWFIHDPVGGDFEVEGEGVVGEQPELGPGQVYEYESYCELQAPLGYMEGFYEFTRTDGTAFRAAIPRFLLRIHAA